MKTLLRLAAVLVAGLVLPGVADEKSSALESSLQVVKSKTVESSSAGVTDWVSVLGQLQQLENCTSGSDLTSCLRDARRYRSQSKNEEIINIWDKVIDELSGKQRTAESSAIAAVTGLVQHIRTSCLAATKAEDIDALFDELAMVQEIRSKGISPRVQAFLSALDNAPYVLTQWQSYLIALEDGNAAGANQTLQNLANNVSAGRPLIPHSEIMKRIQKSGSSEELSKLLAKAKVADLPAIISDLRPQAGSNRYGDSQSIYNLVSHLERLSAWNSAVENGRWSEGLNFMRTSDNYQSPWTADTIHIRRVLEQRTVEGTFNLSLVVKDDKPVMATVEEVADIAAKEGKWPEVFRLLRIIAAFSSYDVTGVRSEINACGNYLGALRLEKAEQWKAAARLYQAVLTAEGKRIPYEEATANLKRLTKEHPEAADPGPATGMPFVNF